MSLEEKWNKDILKFKSLTSDDMQCKNCIHKTEKNATCEIYEKLKPGFVINNTGKKCDFFKKI